MCMIESNRFASRAGAKLLYALDIFKVDVTGKICADFGSSTGGFVDCLLQHGVKKVYAVETGYGLLAWKLRTDPRVMVLEKTNALHVELPEKMDLITIDTGWTKQALILASAQKALKETGKVITLIKPSFEAGKKHPQIKQAADEVAKLLNDITENIEEAGFKVLGLVESPILGAKGRNIEYLGYLAVDK